MGYTISIDLVTARDGLLKGAEDRKLTKENWTGQITSDNQQDVFLAVTSNTLPEGKKVREITVQLFELKGAPVNNSIDAGIWERQEGEKSVSVSLLDEQGKEVASQSEVPYPVYL